MLLPSAMVTVVELGPSLDHPPPHASGPQPAGTPTDLACCLTEGPFKEGHVLEGQVRLEELSQVLLSRAPS